jgi:hypothetical protein
MRLKQDVNGSKIQCIQPVSNPNFTSVHTKTKHNWKCLKSCTYVFRLYVITKNYYPYGAMCNVKLTSGGNRI